jgi:hypothetical protein
LLFLGGKVSKLYASIFLVFFICSFASADEQNLSSSDDSGQTPIDLSRPVEEPPIAGRLFFRIDPDSSKRIPFIETFGTGAGSIIESGVFGYGKGVYNERCVKGTKGAATQYVPYATSEECKNEFSKVKAGQRIEMTGSRGAWIDGWGYAFNCTSLKILPPDPATIRENTLGKVFKRVDESTLKKLVTDTKAFGESWQTPNGTIWGDVLVTPDGEPVRTSCSTAKAMCEKIGGRLPSKADFENVSSYMVNACGDYAPGMLPSFAKDTGTTSQDPWRESLLSRHFCTSTVEYYVTYPGEKPRPHTQIFMVNSGDFTNPEDGDTRSQRPAEVRCIVTP